MKQIVLSGDEEKRRFKEKPVSNIMLNYFEENSEQILYGFFRDYTSEHTINSYRNDLSQFGSYIKENFPDLSILSVKHDHIVSFKNFLLVHGGKNNSSCTDQTINRKLAAIRRFYQYLLYRQIIERDPAQKIKRIRLKREHKTRDISDLDVRKLIDSIDLDSPSGALHKAIILLFFTTGIRHGELRFLKGKNYCEIDGLKVIHYVAKGRKEMTTPLNRECRLALDYYLSWMKEKGRQVRNEDFLFQPTRNRANDIGLNKMLTTKAINYIIKKNCERIGITGKISAHSARATVIGSLLDKGFDIYKVASFVGHDDINTTKGYSKRKMKLRESPSFDLNY